MKPLGSLVVLPTVPDRIAQLRDLANNFWWSWYPEAQQLYEVLDPELWFESRHNPVRVLREVEQDRLDRAAADPEYLARYDATVQAFNQYLEADATWTKREFPQLTRHPVAYFSMEFGLHESLPIYSGGLGVLSGDHLKSASDLGLSLVAVGFFYSQGYFHQRIGPSGTQEAHYEPLNPENLPLRPALDPDGKQATFSVDLPGRQVHGRVWHVQVGRVPLYLLDTDMVENRPEDRFTSARLYHGDAEMRLVQEIVLGIGGVRALRALGHQPAVWHLNEGHAAFVMLERAREYVQQGLSFAEAQEAVKASSIFTTHTPVPAGNDAFHFDLIDRYFGNYWPQLGLDRESFLNVAREDVPWGQAFSMTVLALRMTGGRNGVSELHGEVSRRMWHFLWPEVPTEDVPIGSITNGVHVTTWVGREMMALYDRYLPKDWRDRVDDPETWQAVDQIPDPDLLQARRTAKARLVQYVRWRIQTERRRRGDLPSRIEAAQNLLDPEALTIGFARRFATYKRATLLFRDPERLKQILNRPGQPVQIIFAGKAHPADEPGKALIQRIYQLSQEPGFEGKIVFVEDYDIDLARHLVQGADVWLNNPLRPMEASGTSGQKAAMNGLPNCSVLDGWWREAYDGTNGWAIGEDRDYDSPEARDIADSQSLYNLLENDIIPLYYGHTAGGVPTRWLRVVRSAIKTVAPVYNTHRMVKDYIADYYVPAFERGREVESNDFARARELVAWKQSVLGRWQNVRVEASGDGVGPTKVGQPIPVEARLFLDGVEPEHVLVEVIHARSRDGVLEPLGSTPLKYVGTDGEGRHMYSGSFAPRTSGTVVYGVRALPVHPDLVDKFELGVVRWAEPRQ